jgi:NAD(P)-dependent dehydrogenase (short-subunit alcohol dehydrogenase family)
MGQFGQPDEVAAAIAFVRPKEAGFILGQKRLVDSGASIGKARLGFLIQEMKLC